MERGEALEVSQTLSVRIAAFLVRRRLPLMLIALVLAAVSVDRARYLEFSQSIETMFDRTDPALPPYRLWRFPTRWFLSSSSPGRPGAA